MCELRAKNKRSHLGYQYSSRGAYCTSRSSSIQNDGELKKKTSGSGAGHLAFSKTPRPPVHHHHNNMYIPEFIVNTRRAA